MILWLKVIEWETSILQKKEILIALWSLDFKCKIVSSLGAQLACLHGQLEGVIEEGCEVKIATGNAPHSQLHL